VHEVQVDLLEPEPVEALADRGVRLVSVVPVVPELRGDEQLATRDAARGDRCPDALFVPIDRGVSMCRYPTSSASLTARSVSAGGTLKTP
jgi:hypothetical protein